jgi:hypothetical protein
MLNRAVLIVRPKQPYLDWAAQLDDADIVPNPDQERTVYLIPEFDDDAEAQNVLKRVFAEVFERELFGWHTDESAWPPKRTLAMFRQWFEIELHSVVEDLCGFELIDDEEEF